jgi:hypothetical protein
MISRLEWQKIRLTFWIFCTITATIGIIITKIFLMFVLLIFGCYQIASAIVDMTQGYKQGYFTDKREI